MEALKALAASTDSSLPNQDTAVCAGAAAPMCRLAAWLASQQAPAPELACKPWDAACVAAYVGCCMPSSDWPHV